MFSVRQKQLIAEQVQKILRETSHPELPDSEIQFQLHVKGAESWSWADIQNNGVYKDKAPSVNPHNERQDRDNRYSQGGQFNEKAISKEDTEIQGEETIEDHGLFIPPWFEGIKKDNS